MDYRLGGVGWINENLLSYAFTSDSDEVHACVLLCGAYFTN